MLSSSQRNTAETLSRRSLVRGGVKLAYTVPVISVSFHLSALQARAASVSSQEQLEAAESSGSENQPPNAAAGKSFAVTDDDGDGFAVVTLDGSGSADGDGKIVDYAWSEADLWLSGEIQPSLKLSVGVHRITLTVTDDQGASAQDSMRVRVNPGTTTTEPEVKVAEAKLPDPPYSLTATQKRAEVALKWKASKNGPAPFRIYRAYDDGLEPNLERLQRNIDRIPWSAIHDEPERTSYRDSDVPAGTTYLYAVTSISAVGESAKSNLARILVEFYEERVEPTKAPRPPDPTATAVPPIPTSIPIPTATSIPIAPTQPVPSEVVDSAEPNAADPTPAPST